ncbi:hypothetical protein BS47DRAFT_132827 [Hydnum rufescens UP504]|uniref:Uncharacterized protein n=1 Tax=Hydnum rufescens UP504 TaxID=1448309 RepID=A0A9P6DSQ8_9AGAM|nr:hypothetical protein BS47DRAFT_132827 [Hydnum rufescens UP504]
MVKNKSVPFKSQGTGATPLKSSITHADDDDEAPEIVGLGSAKEDVLVRQRMVKEFQASAVQKRKDANRARDKARKAIATWKSPKNPNSPGKRKQTTIDESDDKIPDEQDLAMHQRMGQAMQDAEEEQDDEAMGDIDAGDSGPDARDSSGEDPLDEGEDQGAELDGDSRRTNGDPAASKKSRRKLSLRSTLSSSAPPSYLPDFIFEAAAKAVASASPPLPTKPHSNVEKKRRKAAQSAKDIVLGSRVVRTLAPASHKAPSSPPASVKRFAKKSMKAKKGRWERRPTNLTISHGIHGPALAFSRKRA